MDVLAMLGGGRRPPPEPKNGRSAGGASALGAAEVTPPPAPEAEGPASSPSAAGAPPGSVRQLVDLGAQNLAAKRDFSATALAYLGDAVWELYARAHHLTPPRRVQDYRGTVESSARAEAQAEVLTGLLVHDLLTPEEEAVARWAKNAPSKVRTSRRGPGLAERG